MYTPPIYLEYNYKSRQYKAVPSLRANKFPINTNQSDSDTHKSGVTPAKKGSVVQNILYAFGFIPPVRRVQSLPDSVKDNNWIRVALLLGMAGINFPRDYTEVQRAWNEGISIKKNGIKNTKFIDAQRPFHLLKGTMVEKWAEKYPKFKKVFNALDKFDKTLYDTKFGKLICKWLDVKETGGHSFNNTGIGTSREFGKFFEENYFKKVIGKSLLRVSRLSLITTALFEVPALLKSLTQKEPTGEKAKSVTKQVIKSAGYVALMSGGTAIAGAMAGSSLIAQLFGMGIGAGLALMASHSINRKIDKTFN
jgi:hypothetical protein